MHVLFSKIKKFICKKLNFLYIQNKLYWSIQTFFINKLTLFLKSSLLLIFRHI